MRAEAGKPFARTADDPELDASLRSRARFGDPMAHLARRGAAADAPPPPVVPAHLARQFRKSGFIVPQARLASRVTHRDTPCLWTDMRATFNENGVSRLPVRHRHCRPTCRSQAWHSVT